MVLDIWAHGTKENPNNLVNKNRKVLDMFNPNHVKSIAVNSNGVQSNNENVEDISSIPCNIDTNFARDTNASNVSHISSNGYYGYCGIVANTNKTDHFMDSDTKMEFESCFENKQSERKKRGFTEELPEEYDSKRLKHDDEIYDNFRQVSFDPNATSIAFTNTTDNQNLNEERNSTQMDLDLIQTNDSEVSLINKVENTNQLIHLKQNSLFEYSLQENIKNDNKINKSNENKRNISYYKYNKNNFKQLNNTENLLENLFMLTHGGSNYQIWQHYDVNIDI
ncbi:putative uncharacterized protein DDB_G0282499 [Condylostylus longicornis]|uniref:putative uncharacterized protein DDB_G0282499 n=1 Tax=Condylostylus longicornis TaxID=2530218 RepID=UPI00244DCB87|nr:putative uncharacterized protein DDB_G0282499 [Condylostylus longicornis]